MNKILCIGASVDLPRDEVKYEDTWFYLLKEKYRNCDFVSYFRRSQILPETDYMFDSYYRFYYPDYVIWEIGITDSAPRYIVEQKLHWKMILRIIKGTWVEKPFWKIVKKVRKRDPKRVATSLTEFENYAEKLIKDFISIGVKKIFLMKIEPIGSSPRRKNPLWFDNIQKYNSVYEKLSVKYSDKVELIAPKENANDDWYIKDGYHPNQLGMRKVFEYLDNVLSNYLK